MNTRDRAFLSDMQNFICMNRFVTTLSLYRTGVEPDEITREVVKILHRESEENEIIEISNNNNGNIQGIMSARIQAELVAGYEDLGSLCSAIKHRAKSSIFEKYLSVKTSEAASFLKEVLDMDIPNHPDITLEDLLNFPSLSQLRDVLPETQFQTLENYYRGTPVVLYQAARQYRLKHDEAQKVQSGTVSISEWKEHTKGHLAVILDFSQNVDPLKRRGILVETFNRIKHQFLVTGDLGSYTDADDPRTLEYMLLARDQEATDINIKAVATISLLMNNIAFLLLFLDQQGIIL